MKKEELSDNFRANILSLNFGDKLDVSNDEIASDIVNDLLEIEKGFRSAFDELLPKLKSSRVDSEETEDILLDMGEEFRHIAYHIASSRFYQYLCIDTPETKSGIA